MPNSLPRWLATGLRESWSSKVPSLGLPRWERITIFASALIKYFKVSSDAKIRVSSATTPSLIGTFRSNLSPTFFFAISKSDNSRIIQINFLTDEIMFSAVNPNSFINSSPGALSPKVLMPITASSGFAIVSQESG